MSKWEWDKYFFLSTGKWDLEIIWAGKWDWNPALQDPPSVVPSSIAKQLSFTTL